MFYSDMRMCLQLVIDFVYSVDLKNNNNNNLVIIQFKPQEGKRKKHVAKDLNFNPQNLLKLRVKAMPF